MLNDKTKLPEFVLAMKEVKELIEAVQPEVDRLNNFIVQLMKQLLINEADDYLNRYEKIYNLSGKGLTIEQRRKNILAKENATSSATRQSILDELRNMTGLPVEIKEVFEENMFTVDLIQNNLSAEYVKAIKKYLDTVKPAHIGYILTLIRYEETFTNVAVATLHSKIISLKEVV